MRTNLICAGAALVLLAGCASESGGSAAATSAGKPQTGSETTTVTAPPPAATATPADSPSSDADARPTTASDLASIGVRRGQLPRDFQVSRKAQAQLPAADRDDELLRCAGVEPVSSERVAGARSATFGSSYGSVWSTTEQFSSRQAVTSTVAALRSSRATTCFGAFFASQRSALTDIDGAPVASSVTVLPGTNDGARNAVGIASARYEYRGNGDTYPVSVGVFYFTGRNLITRVYVINSGGDALDRSLNAIIFPVAARTAAA